MLNLVKNLYSYLNDNQKKSLFRLQFLVILMGLMQLVSVALILPFMTLIGDISQLHSNSFLAELYAVSGLHSERSFVFWFGISVLVVLIIASFASIITTWRLNLFASRVGVELADKLYSYYLKKDWLFHASNSSAEFTKKIASETVRITHGILLPVIHLNSNIVLVLFLSVGIVIFNPVVAIIGVTIFSLSYLLIFKLISLILLKNGRTLSKMYELRFRLMNEGFGGIKDILLLGRNINFIEEFIKTGKIFANSQGTNTALAHAPRYFMELVAFGSMIALVLYFFTSNSGNAAIILPILSVYAISGMKLLPAFQQIFNAVANIKANTGAFESIETDIIEAIQDISILPNTNQHNIYPIENITLEDITFTYPGKDKPVLKNLNMSIPANKTVGIVGPSGSGKSTIIDLILGLIDPQNGQLKIDNKIINSNNNRSWQNSIGFVAQSIFLSEGTIAENIAFGVPKEEINLSQINNSIKIAKLEELVKSLKDGIDTRVGERGVQLSGGQRQRIGIARALYHKANVLVFDEATSALDGTTEKKLVEAIHEFRGEKTIIMIAHRLKTIKDCELIYFIDNGTVEDFGNYDELVKKNDKFRKMSENA